LELEQYLSMFIEESKEHLQALNASLLDLEHNKNDLAIVHHIFRSAHTLKGMSATMGYVDIASLTHQMENVLDLLRNQKLQMDDFIFDCLFKSTDALEVMVENIVQGGTGKADVSQIIVSLKTIISGDHLHQATLPVGLSSPNNSAISDAVLDEYQYSVMELAIKSGHRVYYLEVSVTEDCVLKAARAYMVFDLFEKNGEVIKSVPSIEEIEQEKFGRGFTVYFISDIEQDALKKSIMNISEIDQVNVFEMDLAGLKQVSRVGNNLDIEAAVAATAENAASAHVPVAGIGNAPITNRTIRVDIERLDSLMNLFSELLIDRVRLEQLSTEIKQNDLIETVEHISRVSSDLQNIVLKLRMVPVDTVFNRFPRMIRDIAKTLNKKVELIILGADTELDRTVIDEIGDPLVHMLRNAIDHGLETTAERKIAGKNETGTIYLRAFHSGNHVFIEIEEDGRGISRDKVLKTAIKNGVISTDEAEKMSDEDVYQLLFATGFSTAEKISDISGRGVGLDVVKTKIHSLNGHVTIESKPGKGTKFSVQLPLTLSIITAMLLKVGSEKYAIPLSSILETATVRKSKIHHSHGNLLVDYRSGVVPLIPLSKIFDVPADAEKDQDENEDIDIVIIKKGEKIAALIVSEFLGQQEIVIKSLGKYFTHLFALSGATILGDGQVALILDPNALIK